MKGAVARQYYERIKGIKRGYACDAWRVKYLPSPWKRLKMDALDLLDVLHPDSVDVTQAFGFMEHLKKKDGFKFLDIAESLSRKLVVVSGAFTIHGAGGDPAYKVKRDGNPYHYYHSTWSYDDFEPLGYTTSREHDSKNEGYGADVVAWKKL